MSTDERSGWIKAVALSASPLAIPPRFHDVVYVGVRYPGASGVCGVEGGANCQQFAYELIRSFGLVIPDFRSSELWEDQESTRAVSGALEPLDLLLFNRKRKPWGAHVAVYLGDDLAIHLCRGVGAPVIWRLEDFARLPEYACFLGARRVVRKRDVQEGCSG